MRTSACLAFVKCTRVHSYHPTIERALMNGDLVRGFDHCSFMEKTAFCIVGYQIGWSTDVWFGIGEPRLLNPSIIIRI